MDRWLLVVVLEGRAVQSGRVEPGQSEAIEEPPHHLDLTANNYITPVNAISNISFSHVGNRRRR